MHGDIDDLGDIVNIANFASAFFSIFASSWKVNHFRTPVNLSSKRVNFFQV